MLIDIQRSSADIGDKLNSVNIIVSLRRHSITGYTELVV